MKYGSRKNSFLLMFSWRSKKLYERMFRAFLEEIQLTQNEADVLLFLKNNKPLDTAKDIVEYRAISKSMVSKSVESLLARGYLSYEEDENDRRCLHLMLEASAEPVIKKLQKIQNEFLEVIHHDITQEELEILDKVLNKMNKNMSNEINK